MILSHTSSPTDPSPAQRPGFKASLLFASALILGLPLTVGINLDAALGILVAVPLAVVIFLRWETGSWVQRIPGIAIRSSIFLSAFLSLWIGYVSFVDAGQLGSGDALMIDGHRISLEGHKYLGSQGLGATALVFGAALLAPAATLKGTRWRPLGGLGPAPISSHPDRDRPGFRSTHT